jgi:nitrogen regulatory protein P-II 1
VKGYGRQKSYLDEYSETEYSLAFLPKVEIVLWVDDARVGEVVRKIVDVARTGRMGDGKILVLPVASWERAIDVAAADRATP